MSSRSHATVREVGQLLRLRITLADRAGTLAQAATIIGFYGGNIVSIDVHRTAGEAAVDDLVVEFTDEPHLDDLRSDLALDASTTLVAHEAARAGDPIEATLRQVIDLLQSGVGDPNDALARAVGDLCFTPVVWVSSAEEAGRYEAGRSAVERNAAVARRMSELRGPGAERLPGEVCLVAVPDLGRHGEGRVVFAARPSTIEFTPTEVSRIEALIVLHNQLEPVLANRRAPASPPT